ncbi:unnamed protein product [Meganyctiphanes norvegica]|uniref:DDE-1 domain-containing protein n=1 Tax=Meganyctiphanes norvegica TaxID=48144 RepID=A0AAV2PIC5_MEGNR
MTGTEKKPLFVIGRYQNPKAFKNRRHKLRCTYRWNDKSWMRSDLFTQSSWQHWNHSSWCVSMPALKTDQRWMNCTHCHLECNLLEFVMCQKRNKLLYTSSLHPGNNFHIYCIIVSLFV